MMFDHTETSGFESINAGYNATFKPGKLSLGLIVPIESYAVGAVPDMQYTLARVKLAEELGFAAVWLRDVPFNVPSFGDPGQMYDPFVYLGFLAASTSKIALGTGSIILPLRHPAHVAKSAASVDVLSGGRLIMGVASGDRPEEYPALNLPFENRGERFREAFEYIRRMADEAPQFNNDYGRPYGGMDMLPKPTGGKVPMLITGASQQSPEWLAQNGDGWITYPRSVPVQQRIITDWRARSVAEGRKPGPAMQSLYIDLMDDPDFAPQPIHLGFRSGVKALRDYLASLQDIGINHVGINLRLNQADTTDTMKKLADEILPDFASV